MYAVPGSVVGKSVMVTAIIICVVLLFAKATTGIETVITQDVESQNHSVGAPTIGFLCKASKASYCNWEINNEFSANRYEVKFELNISNYMFQDGSNDVNANADITCVLEVPTGPAYNLVNGTRVQCIPVVALGNFNTMNVYGNTAKMLLQGQYASVGDIYFSNESFAIKADWNPPYHLLGVHPMGYNCTVSVLSTGEHLQTSVNVDDTSCTFELDENLTCAVLVMEVVAYNQWVVGDTETAYWSLGGSVQPGSIAFMLTYADGPYFTLSVEFEVVGVCLEHLQQVVVMAACSLWTKSNVQDVKASNNSDIENGATLTGTITGLPEDQHCFFIISLLLATMESVNTTMRKFSTFDLEQVIVTPVEDSFDYNLCITCTLREGSDARGCLVSLKPEKDNKTETSNFFVGNAKSCRTQKPGQYYVEVFDHHADGNFSMLAAFSQNNFRIPNLLKSPQPVSPSPTGTSTDPPVVAGLSTTAIIGLGLGISAFVFLVIIVVLLATIVYMKKRMNNKSNHPVRLREVRTIECDVAPLISQDDLQYYLPRFNNNGLYRIMILHLQNEQEKDELSHLIQKEGYHQVEKVPRDSNIDNVTHWKKSEAITTVV